jgi:phosphatidylcholine synthase
MANNGANNGKVPQGTPSGKSHAAGLAVHAFTASGAVLGFLALLAALDGHFATMFAWLALALVVDAVDGSFARRADVKRTAPEFSGEILDLVVDFITYVLVPAYAMYRAGLMPEVAALPATALILVTSALYFADVRMKTDDWYFRGFPGVWNLFAFMAFVLNPGPWVVLALVVLFSALTFAPIAFVHPMRVTQFRALNIAMMIAGGVLCALALWWNLEPPPVIRFAIAAAGAYFLLIGLLRPAARP